MDTMIMLIARSVFSTLKIHLLIKLINRLNISFWIICNCSGTKYLNEVQYCNVNCFPRISHNNEPRNFYSIKEVEIHLSWEYLLTYKSYVSWIKKNVRANFVQMCLDTSFKSKVPGWLNALMLMLVKREKVRGCCLDNGYCYSLILKKC